MITDIISVARSLARSKGFVLITVITLALGIGSASSIFCTVDWVLFRSNNYPADLRLIGTRYMSGDFMPFCFAPQFQACREQTNVFSEFQVVTARSVNVVLDGVPVTTGVTEVSPGLMPTFKVTPTLGRGFQPGEDVAGHNDVVIISHAFWQKNFGSSNEVLGRSITVGGTACTIIGVLPKKADMPVFAQSDVYRPYVPQINPENPFSEFNYAIVRLKPGVTQAAAEQAVSRTTFVVAPIMAAQLNDYRLAVVTMAELHRWFHPEILAALLGAVGFLYAIACLNAANLMLTRLLGKKHEHSIRLALGASRWRIVRLLAIESAGLSLLASAGGLLVANWLFPLCLTIAGSGAIEGSWHWWLDLRAVAVLGGLTVVTALAIVVLPAIRILRSNAAESLKEDRAATGESPTLRRLRGGFVVLQAAFAVVLLTGAGLMVRTFTKLEGVPLGFETDRRMKVQLILPSDHLREKQPYLDFLRRLQERLQQLPGVVAATYGSNNLMAGFYAARDTVELADGTPIRVNIDYAAPNYPATVGLKLMSGRWLNETAANEIVISESFARVRYPNQNPIGQLLRPPTAAKDFSGWTVVGVFGDVRDSARGKPGYRIYASETWFPPVMDCCVLRLSREVDPNITRLVQRTIYEFDPRVVCQITPLSDGLGQQLQFEKFTLAVLKVLSAIALLLTIAGVFSVLAYSVDRRKREYGLRFALGATPGNVVRLVLGRGMLLTGAGIVLGLAGALALSRFLQSVLFETPPYDPIVLLAVSSVLIVAAAIACVWPAWRAAKVDVARLLQAE